MFFSRVAGIPAGTLVTPESFASWKAKFDASQVRKHAASIAIARLAISLHQNAQKQAKEAEKKAALVEGKEPEPKYTGKQLFLMNLAKNLGLDDGAY